MKFRSGFVSNSSSASFILNKELLTSEQIIGIKNYVEVAKRINETSKRECFRRNVKLKDGSIIRVGKYEHLDKPMYDGENEFGEGIWKWSIKETDKTIEGSCILDEFDFGIFLEDIQIPKEAILDFKCGNITEPYKYPEPLDIDDL